MSEYVPVILGVPVVRARDGAHGWHVEWWQHDGDTDVGPFMVIGCTAESAGQLVRVLAADTQRYRLIGAYDIEERRTEGAGR